MTVRALLVLILAACLAPVSAADAGGCPNVPDAAFAFIGFGSVECPVAPRVRWTDATVQYDCDFLSDPDKLIECAGDASRCVQLCRASAQIWNTNLPSRFNFVPAPSDGATSFCDCPPGDVGGEGCAGNDGGVDWDGRVSVGGTQTLCDGTAYGSRVLAVTLSLFFSSGSQAGKLIDANITVNQRFAFSQNEFQATLAHEFGHVLGLSHPDQCDEDLAFANVLMRSSSLLNGDDECFVKDPTQADLNGAELIYPVVSPTPGLCGDADLNGAISVLDGVQTLRAAADLPSSCTPSRCDVDGNGSISVSDGVNVLRGAAGLSFTAACP